MPVTKYRDPGPGKVAPEPPGVRDSTPQWAPGRARLGPGLGVPALIPMPPVSDWLGHGPRQAQSTTQQSDGLSLARPALFESESH